MGLHGHDVTPPVIGTVYYYDWQIQTENISYARYLTNQWDGPTTNDSWFQEFYDNEGAGRCTSSVIYGYVLGTSSICYSREPTETITTP